MNNCVKCELCTAEISGERCIFAMYVREIDGEKHYFCCKNHANEYEKKVKKRRDSTPKENI